MIPINRNLKKQNEQDTDVFATFVHELKTPVTSIKEAISLLSDINKDTLNLKTKRIIAIAQEEINRLVRMIENFLKVAAIEDGKIQLQIEPVNINEIINLVLESQSLVVQRKNMHIKKILTSKPPILSVDKDRIFEAVSNLIDNALKFTPNGGTITIKTQLLPKTSFEIRSHSLNPKLRYMKITVSDTGSGILKKDLKRIFEKFERLTAPTKIRGIGLGLTIAKTIIELHYGQIWATSEKNKGANFHFVLPIKN
jgi:signal transduction histidine kinase